MTRGGQDDTAGQPALLLLGCLLGTAALASINTLRPASGSQVLVALLGLTAAGAALLSARRLPAVPGRSAIRTLCVGLLVVTGSTSLCVTAARYLFGDPRRSMSGLLLGAATVIALLVAAGILFLAGHGGRWGLPVLVVLGLANVPVLLRVPEVTIDVLTFQRDGVTALLHGVNPYGITFANPYPPDSSRLFYGPGLVQDGRLLFGFPYPPASLLLVVPGHLLGDVRFSMAGALLVAAALLWYGGGGRHGRGAAAALLLLPGGTLVLLNAWTEPMILGLLAAAVVAMRRGWRAAPYLLGVLLVMKQYLIVLLPLLWLLEGVARRSRWGLRGFSARVAGTGLAVSAPLALWSPTAFWDSVVRLQLLQPFRADSTSLLVWLVNRTGWPPPSVYGWLPLAAGLGTACLVAWRAPRTPAGFAGGIAVTLLVTFMLSKQAFANYYFLALGALLVAAGTWTGPAPTNGPAGGPAPSTERPGRPRPAPT